MRLVTYVTTNLTENRTTTSYARAQAWRAHGAKVKVVLKEVGTPNPRHQQLHKSDGEPLGDYIFSTSPGGASSTDPRRFHI